MKDSPENKTIESSPKTQYNKLTRKWVTRLRPSTRGKTDMEKWQRLGYPKKFIYVPINTDLDMLEKVAVGRGLNYQHLLFILHKLLYNRLTFRKYESTKKSIDYFNNYTPLGSVDLYKWLGKNYLKCLNLLCEIGYLIPKKSAQGTKSYFNGGGLNSQTCSFKLDRSLFNHDLFEKFSHFKRIELTDVKLIIKLATKNRIKTISDQKVHSLLAKAIQGVKIKEQVKLLNQNYTHETVQQMLFLADLINSGEIYVKPEFDSYGERFHSTFTFTWSALRPFIYFENKVDKTVYLDLRNSQFFFFSLLGTPQAYEVIPEFKQMLPIFQKLQAEVNEFNHRCQDGSLYDYCKATHGLSKGNLMELFFGKSSQFKTKRKKLPWLTEILKEIEFVYQINILPSALQRLESRTLLKQVCKRFLTHHPMANLISIHDGLLIEKKYLEELECTLDKCFAEMGFPSPKRKIAEYEGHPDA